MNLDSATLKDRAILLKVNSMPGRLAAKNSYAALIYDPALRCAMLCEWQENEWHTTAEYDGVEWDGRKCSARLPYKEVANLDIPDFFLDKLELLYSI